MSSRARRADDAPRKRDTVVITTTLCEYLSILIGAVGPLAWLGGGGEESFKIFPHTFIGLARSATVIGVGNRPSRLRDEFADRNGHADDFPVGLRLDQREHAYASGARKRKQSFRSDDQLRLHLQRGINPLRLRLFGIHRADACTEHRNQSSNNPSEVHQVTSPGAMVRS
jgi:hypothetical protein